MTFESDTFPIQVCPRCGSEFQPQVMECLDCGTGTVAAWDGRTEGMVRSGDGSEDDGGEEAGIGDPEPFRDVEDLGDYSVVLSEGSISWLRPLLTRLRRDGIETRVVPGFKFMEEPLLTALVRPADEERARQIELKVYSRQFPELPGSPNRGTTDACPGCGARLSPRASQCPDCGLEIWEESEQEGE